MAQDNPFADLIPAQPQSGQPPARIYGGPKPVDPMEAARFQLSVNSDARADRSAERQDAAAARAAAAAERQAALDSRKITNETRLTENEGKTTAFYNRALGANRDFESSGVATEPRGYLAQTAVDILPDGVTNAFSSSERQKAEQAKRDFIAASLRYESGAAISPQEFDKQEKTFFPQPNEGPEVIEQKRRARQRIIESFKIGAGRGADEVDALRGPQPAASRDPGALTFNDQLAPTQAGLNRLSPAQEADLKAFALTKPSADALRERYAIYGAGELSPENAAQLAEYFAKGGTEVGVDYSGIEAKAVNPGDGTAGAIVRGAANAGSLGLVNRIGAAVDTIGGNGTYNENLNRRRGYDLYDQENNGAARLGGQVLGGLAVPIVGGTSAANLARNGAGIGALYGYNDSYGDTSSRLIAAGGNAVAGGALGYAGGRAAEYLAGRGGPPPPPGPGQELIAAAGRQNVPITAADAYPGLRGTVGALEAVPGSSGAIRRPLQAGTDRIEQRVAEIGGDQNVGRAGMGDAIQTGLQNRDTRMGAVVGRAYDRAERAAGNATITPRAAVANIDQQLTDLGATANTSAPVIQALETLRADMANGANPNALSVAAVRRLRTNVREQAQTEALRSTDYQRRAGQVLDALRTDIGTQLPGGAARAYNRADRLHAERVGFIDDIAKRFLGGTDTKAMSAEQTANKVATMSNPIGGDHARLTRMISTLEPQERQQVAGTIAAELGRRGVDGDNAFSPALFFSQIQKYSPEARAAIWGRQGAADIADLARIAEQRGGVIGRLNNSRSGAVSNWFQAVKGIVVGGGAGAGLGAAAGVGAGSGAGAIGAGLVVSNLTARALGSQRLLSTLAAAGRARTPQAQSAIITRLSQIATREPAIANDILPIQRALQESLPRQAAAEDKKQNRRQ